MMYRKVLALTLTVNFMAQTTLAETWLVFPNQNLNSRQIDERIEEFKKQAPNKIVIPAFEGMQHEDLGNKKVAQLKELFERAEDAFFANNFAQAKQLHKQFSQALLESHFRGAIKNFLIRSLLRQSQLQVDPQIAQEIMVQAASLAPQFSPSHFGFSPSIVDLWKKTLAKTGSQNIPLKIQMPATGIVFLDGQKLNFVGTDQVFLIKRGFHHLAALIPNSRWTVHTIELNSPSTDKFLFVPLVNGTCERPQYLGEDLPKGVEAAALFENGCAVVFKDENSVLRFTNAGLTELPPQLEPGIKTDLASEFEKEPSTFEKTIKSPWLWVALGAVVAGVLINKSQNESGRVVPVHTSH